jgi:multidrug efflux pump subunit AcrB
LYGFYQKEEKLTKTTNWLSKPITSLCVCLFIIIASLFILINSNNKVEAEISSEYTITIRHYGIDMNEIQRTISIPLEDALSALDGVKNILSSSEDGRSRVFVLFNDKENKLICKSKKTGRYEALRDAVQRVYETLPPSVQRPEITAVNLSMNPVWVAAIVFKEDVKTANNILNKVIKPALSGLDGAANVEISGIGVNEIIISLKPEETASAHLNSVTIANFLSKNDIILPGGHLNNKESETMIMIDGRYESIEALRNTLIPLDNGAVVALKDIAEINENEREPDILSRLNGEKTVIISVLPVFGSDTGKLSNLIAQEVKKLKKYPVEFIIINDRGAEESAAFHSIVIASIQSVLALMIICALMMRKNGKVIWKSSIICAFFVPVSALISAAVLSLIGINFDKTTLAVL